MKKYISIIKNFVSEIIADEHGNFAIYKFISLLPTNFFRGLFWMIWICSDRESSLKWFYSKKRNRYLVYGSLVCSAHGIDNKIWKQQCADLHKIITYQV